MSPVQESPFKVHNVTQCRRRVQPPFLCKHTGTLAAQDMYVMRASPGNNAARRQGCRGRLLAHSSQPGFGMEPRADGLTAQMSRRV